MARPGDHLGAVGTGIVVVSGPGARGECPRSRRETAPSL